MFVNGGVYGCDYIDGYFLSQLGGKWVLYNLFYL